MILIDPNKNALLTENVKRTVFHHSQAHQPVQMCFFAKLGPISLSTMVINSMRILLL